MPCGEPLEKIIVVDSRAFHARVAKAATLIDQSHLGPADDELRKVEKERPDYYEALFVRSIWHLKGGHKSKAVDSLNQALKKAPALERKARELPIFEPIIDSPDISWPSKS